MAQGTVKTITDKGYGFISREGEEKDLFYHNNSLVDDVILEVGDTVSFDVEEGPKGLSAINVKRVE